jgi:hypothetical protein
MNSGSKPYKPARGHEADRKFLAWVVTADAIALRAKRAQLARQKDFPLWKRAAIERALARKENT